MAFNTTLTPHCQALRERNYLHLENVLSQDFTNVLGEVRDRILSGAQDDIPDWHIEGKKRQYLFDFPSEAFLEDFLLSMSEITGKAPENLTIGERHIKVYLENAAPFPAPHLDRRASEFTVGFPIVIPDASEVCFLPHLGFEENTDERARFIKLGDGVDMAAYYKDPRIVKAQGRLGDMFIFYGSRVWHERIHPAGSMILYTKLNTMGSDPLGENRALHRETVTA